MELLELITKNFGLIILLLLILGGVIIIRKIIKKINRTVKRSLNQISTVKQTINDISNLSKIVATEEAAAPKSVGGATSMYLKKIINDFPGFHNQDAEAAIKTFIIEYLNIKYNNQSEFKKSNVNNNILLNINKENKQNISNIKFNGIAIYNYDKTADYATITYRCSFGYDLNNHRQEVRYDIDYTLQLFDNNIAQKAMKCSNCGGTLSTKNGNECPYCGTKVIMDTIMNWYITEVTKNL